MHKMNVEFSLQKKKYVGVHRVVLKDVFMMYDISTVYIHMLALFVSHVFSLVCTCSYYGWLFH